MCTFRRDHVRETLKSILEQRGVDLGDIEIIVADDDPQLSARGPIAEIRPTSTTLRYIESGAASIAAARNCCLSAARAPWIAFIDDDEIADPMWLSSLLRVQADHDADIVKGIVVARYPAGAPDWLRKSRSIQPELRQRWRHSAGFGHGQRAYSPCSSRTTFGAL